MLKNRRFDQNCCTCDFTCARVPPILLHSFWILCQYSLILLYSNTIHAQSKSEFREISISDHDVPLFPPCEFLFYDQFTMIYLALTILVKRGLLLNKYTLNAARIRLYKGKFDLMRGRSVRITSGNEIRFKISRLFSYRNKTRYLYVNIIC